MTVLPSDDRKGVVSARLETAPPAGTSIKTVA